VHVTDSACEALSKLLAKRNSTERCLRLSTVQGNYRFIIDEPIEHDISYRYEERVVLVVSETVSRELWGITIDCADEVGKTRLIFRKAAQGEPLDAVRDDAMIVPPQWRASEHEKLLEEIAEIGRQIADLRASPRNALRDQLHNLEVAKQEKWDAIRALWAGDGGWHKKHGNGNGNGAVNGAAEAPVPATAAARTNARA
jgi:hypothetical protein